jgi:DMSO/TMAO reductase YedYZ molybdopterin-dependent catalytic subunit
MKAPCNRYGGIRYRSQSSRKCLTWEVPGRSAPVRWSVGIEAEGDRVLTREEVVELADAVAVNGGIATGIGTSRYGAQLIVEASSREDAIAAATREFTRAVAQAGLPARPVVRTEAVSEDEDATA